MFCLTHSVLSWDVLAALGRSVGHCPVRAGLSGLSLDVLRVAVQPEAGMFSLRLVVRSGVFRSALECDQCFLICAGTSGLQLFDLSLAGLRLPGLSWNVWSEAMAVQSELECLV